MNISDPADQFAWINNTLSAARSAGERVLVIGHAPRKYSLQYRITLQLDMENEIGDFLCRKCSIIGSLSHSHHLMI